MTTRRGFLSQIAGLAVSAVAAVPAWRALATKEIPLDLKPEPVPIRAVEPWQRGRWRAEWTMDELGSIVRPGDVVVLLDDAGERRRMLVTDRSDYHYGPGRCRSSFKACEVFDDREQAVAVLDLRQREHMFEVELPSAGIARFGVGFRAEDWRPGIFDDDPYTL